MTPGAAERRNWPVWTAVGVGALLLHLLQWALLPFVLAAILGFITDPLIRRIMGRTGAPRWAVGGGLYIVLFLAGLTLLAGVGWTAFGDLSHLAGAGAEPFRSDLAEILGPKGMVLFGQRVDANTAADFLHDQAHRFLNALLVVRTGGAALALGIGIVLLVFLTFYAMVSGPRLAQGALWLVPPTRRPAVERVLPAMVKVIQHYFIGVVVIVAFTTVAAWIGYGLVVHVHNALLLSIAVGVLETVPAIGAATGAVLVGMAALQLHSLTAAAVMVAYAIALRLTIDDLVAPLVLGRSVLVHPVVVMLAYVLGAVLFGAIGLLLAVPAAACLRIALADAYERPRA